METTAVRPPFGVRFLSILLYVGAVLDILAGILLITQRNSDDVLDSVGATSGEITTLGVITIVFGVVVFMIASALRGGSNFARLLVGVIAVVRLIALIWVSISYHRVHWYDSIAPTLVYLLVAGYLFFDDDAKAFFRR